MKSFNYLFTVSSLDSCDVSLVCISKFFHTHLFSKKVILPASDCIAWFYIKKKQQQRESYINTNSLPVPYKDDDFVVLLKVKFEYNKEKKTH